MKTGEEVGCFTDGCEHQRALCFKRVILGISAVVEGSCNLESIVCVCLFFFHFRRIAILGLNKGVSPSDDVA